MEEQANAPFWKPALLYGAILGFAGILLSVIFYFLGLMTANWTQWISLLVGAIVMAWCLTAYRNEYLGGFAPFGKLFVMGLVIGILSVILGTLYNLLLFNVIDPGLVETMRLAAEENILNNPRIPEEAHDQLLERIENSMSVNRIVIMGLIFGIVLNTIIALIVSAFVKKNPEQPVA